MASTKVVILGAAGYDYHVFNMVYRNDPNYEVLAFSFCTEQNLGTTAAGERKYPSSLAGNLYPNGIPFIPESSVGDFIRRRGVKLAVFAYSDISHIDLMHRASICTAAGADFTIISPARVQLKSSKPVISVCAVRTGTGKSSVARAAVRYFQQRGLRAIAVREPMPYGDLERQKCMRFETYQDFARHNCTIEEREEYEPYVANGMVIYSGVDYEVILREVESQCDVIVWDGGNNEVSFFKSDLLMVLADPLRPGHETSYHPGELNVRMADAFVIAKAHEASLQDIAHVERTLLSMQPQASIVRLGSITRLERPRDELKLAGKRAIICEDGPTMTHGGIGFGAGYVLAKKLNLQVVDPRISAKGSYKDVFRNFPHVEMVIPAMGYDENQIQDLADTLNSSDADVVINGSPSDLEKLLGSRLKKPMYRVLYDVTPVENSPKSLNELFQRFLNASKL